MPGIGKLQSLRFLHILFQLDPLYAFRKGQVFIAILLFSTFLVDTENYRGNNMPPSSSIIENVQSTSYTHLNQILHTSSYISQLFCSSIKLSLLVLHAKGLQNSTILYMCCSNNMIAAVASLQLHFLSNDAFSYYILQRPSALAYQSNQS